MLGPLDTFSMFPGIFCAMSDTLSWHFISYIALRTHLAAWTASIALHAGSSPLNVRRITCSRLAASAALSPEASVPAYASICSISCGRIVQDCAAR